MRDNIKLVEQLENMTRERLSTHPENNFYRWAEKDVQRIAEVVRAHKAFDVATFNELKIGQLCAKELEDIDPEYTKIVYLLLDAIDPQPLQF